MSHIHQHPHHGSRGQLPRRKLLKGGVSALSGMVAAQLASPLLDEASQTPRSVKEAAISLKPSDTEPCRIFDAHLHCPAESGERWQWHPVTRTFEEFVAYLDQTGVQRGIINSQRCQNKGTPAEFVAGNREVARYVERYKGRFMGACVVNPQFIDEALREMEECREQLGFVWVGELCNYMEPYQYTIKEFDMLVEKAVELNMVLDVHTDLEEMEYIIQKYPNATIVFPHFGDRQERAHIFPRIELVATHPNCYVDTSGRGYDRMGMLEYAIKTVGPDRILFGSDFSINDPSAVIARIQHSFLTEEQKRKVLSENLQQLLKKVQA